VRWWLEDTFTVVDVETSGVDVHDRVLEVGAVRFSIVDHGRFEYRNNNELVMERPPAVQQVQTLSHRVRPCDSYIVPAVATAINGITTDGIAAASRFGEVAWELKQIMKGATLVAYNGAFDLRMLCAEASRAGMLHDLFPMGLYTPVLDPLVIVRQHAKYMKGRKLTDIAGRLGMDTTGAHGALADCLLTQTVMVGAIAAAPALRGMDTAALLCSIAAWAEAQQAEWLDYVGRRYGTPTYVQCNRCGAWVPYELRATSVVGDGPLHLCEVHTEWPVEITVREGVSSRRIPAPTEVQVLEWKRSKGL